MRSPFHGTVRTVRLADEQGIAMFYALLVTLVVGGIVTVVVATSLGQTRQSAFELNFEDSLHVAEAGLETVLQRLDESSQYATVGADGLPVLGPGSSDDPHDWAVDAATDPEGGGYNLPTIDIGEGEAVAIRPTGRDADYAYGIGFHPSRQAYVDGAPDAYVRVTRVKVGFTDTEVVGSFAILAGEGLVSSSSSYGVLGLNGSVHSNGFVDIQHDAVAGTVSFSDPGEGCRGSVCPPDPDIVGPVAEETMPSSTIDDVWARPDSEVIAAAGDWYDYCDGTGRHSPTNGSGWYLRGDDDPAPCSGTWLGASTRPAGWSSGLRMSAVDDTNKVYWVDSASNVRVDQVAGRASVIVKGDIRFGPTANTQGMLARYPGLLMFAEGDVSVDGNASSVEPDGAIIYAGGDLDIQGTADSVGIAYITQGEARIIGGAQISYDGNAVADIGGDGDPLVFEWEEIR